MSNAPNSKIPDERIKYLDAIYYESLPLYSARHEKLPFIRNLTSVIDATHHYQALSNHSVTRLSAAKVLVPGFYDINSPEATHADKLFVEDWASTSPEYKKAVMDYAEWLEICDDIYTLTFSRKIQQGVMPESEYTSQRQMVINRIFNAQEGSESKAAELYEVLEGYAEDAMKTSRLAIDHEFLGEDKHVSRHVNQSVTYRVACSHFLDKAMWDDYSYYQSTNNGLVKRLEAYNSAESHGNKKHRPISLLEVLTVMNYQECQSVNNLPLMWNYHVGKENWNAVEKFLEGDKFGATLAKELVHLRHTFEGVFALAYQHRGDASQDALKTEMEIYIESLCKRCPEIRSTTASLELSRTIPMAEKAIAEAQKRGRNFGQSV